MSTTFNQDDALDQELNTSAFESSRSGQNQKKNKKSSWLLYTSIGVACVFFLGAGLWNMFGKRFFSSPVQNEQPLQMQGADFTDKPIAPLGQMSGTQAPVSAYPAKQNYSAEQLAQVPAAAQVPGSIGSPMVTFEPQPQPQASSTSDTTYEQPVNVTQKQSSPFGSSSTAFVGIEEQSSIILERLDKLEKHIDKLKNQIEEFSRQSLAQHGALKDETNIRHENVLSSLKGIESALNALAEARPVKPTSKPATASPKAILKSEAKESPKERTEAIKPAPPARPTVNLRGILDERATLQTRNGESLSVVVGDKIPGSAATVTRVDPDRGEVLLSDGQVLR